MSTGTVQTAAVQVITDLKSDSLQLGFTNDSGNDLVSGDEVTLKTDGTIDIRDAGTEVPLGIVVKGGVDGSRVTVRTNFTAVIVGVAAGGTINAGSFVKPNGSKTGSYPQYAVVTSNDYAVGLVLKGSTVGGSMIIGILDGVYAGGSSAVYTSQALAAYTADNESSAYSAEAITTNPADLSEAAAKVDVDNMPSLDDVNALRVAYENLRAHVEDISAKLVTSGILTTP